jgi:hypothetical protein
MGAKKNSVYTEDGWSLLYGWGVYDQETPYYSRLKIGSKYKINSCPYFVKWFSMLMRVFDTKYLEKYPSYKCASICEEWKYFSNFKAWVDNQPNKNWVNCHLDKDLLSAKKHYSPNTCVFISEQLNNFILVTKRRGKCLLGVSIEPKSKINPYKVGCSNPFTKKNDFVGNFSNELEAHKAWQARKHQHALALSELQSDQRVIKVLQEMYAPDKDWTKV